MVAAYNSEPHTKGEMRCPCGCIMIWGKHRQMWLCISCDLKINPQEYSS